MSKLRMEEDGRIFKIQKNCKKSVVKKSQQFGHKTLWEWKRSFCKPLCHLFVYIFIHLQRIDAQIWVS